MKAEGRSARWPALLLLAGAAGLVRSPALERLCTRGEELLLSAARCVDPRAWRIAIPTAHAAGADEPSVEAPDGAIDPRVRIFLERARAQVLPSPDLGWRRDGEFHVVELGESRAQDELPLAGPGALPPGEPVFHGDSLVGSTPADADLRPRVRSVLARGVRLPATTDRSHASAPRFLVVGDGSDTLRVSLVDGSAPLSAGETVFAVDAAAPSASATPSASRGAILGTLELSRGCAGADRAPWRVRPTIPLSSLVEVAIRFPPGFPGPSDLALVPLAVPIVAWSGVDARRRAFVVPVGAELGVAAGSAAASGPYLVGRVARAGWQRALVRRVEDPGFRARALVLDGERALPWTFTIVARRGDELVCAELPPAADLEGALVVSAASADGTPEGLLIGTLGGDARTATIRRDLASTSSVTVLRPRGPWSEEP